MPSDLFLRSAVRPPITTKSRGTIEQVRATLLKPQTRKIPLQRGDSSLHRMSTGSIRKLPRPQI